MEFKGNKTLLEDSKGLKISSEEKVETIKKFEIMGLKEDLMRGVFEYGNYYDCLMQKYILKFFNTYRF